MRKVIYAINLSLDGCCAHDKFGPDDELHGYFVELNRNSSAMLYGRKTYELMVPFWPDIAKNPSGTPGMDEFAKSFVEVAEMFVVSKTLTKADGHNAKVLGLNFIDEIRKIKHTAGKPILTGGIDIPGQLLQAGLIDEMHLLIHPVMVGEGRRLFDNVKLSANQNFKLQSSKPTKSGTIVNIYVK